MLASRARRASKDRYNAFVSVVRDTRREARAGDLSSWRVAVKDNICTKQFPTTCSSEILRDFQPRYDATIVSLLDQAGAFVLGKTNCDEFGMGSTNVYSIWGPAINPWSVSERRSAGGSSGGSAAAVAASLCDAAIGTDTGGSVRLPASYCGVVGFKPTYGFLSRHGVVAFADSLDCVGLLTRRVSHAASLFDVLNNYDELDPTAVPLARRRIASESWRRVVSSGSSLEGLVIGVPKEFFPKELDSHISRNVSNVLGKIRRAGAIVKAVSLPHTRLALSAYYIIANAEASSNLSRFDGIRYGSRNERQKTNDDAETFSQTRAWFGAEVQRRILLGTYSLMANAFDNYFLKALRVRQAIMKDYDAAFRIPNCNQVQCTPESSSDGVDVVIHPTAIQPAPKLDDNLSGRVELDSYVQDVMTVPASLAGLPAISIPTGVGKDGWPLGMSIVGQWGTDELVLQTAQLIEDAISS